MSKPRRSQRASEFMAELQADPEYQRRTREHEALMQQRAAELSIAEAPLVTELQAAGVSVQSVWDLVNAPHIDRETLSILAAHLRGPYPERIREGIARALAVPDARIVWNELLAAFLAEPDTTPAEVKWALHLALAMAADITTLDCLVALATTRRHGRNRVFFVDALARFDDARATAALAALESDPDLSRELRRVRKSGPFNPASFR